jgi:hypothetical protein
MGAPYTNGKGFGILAASIKLAKNQRVQGTALAIHLSDDQATTVWKIVVKAQTSEGEYVVGTLKTRAPIAGDPRVRTVGLAFVPGVLDWTIDVYGTRGATARFVLTAGPSIQNPIEGTKEQRELADLIASCCPPGAGGTFALVPANGSRLMRRIWDPPGIINPALVQGVLSPGPDVLTKVYGATDPALPLGTVFGLVDKDSAIVAGDQWRIAPVPVTPGVPFSFTFDPDGVDFDHQARWVLSSTVATATPIAGAGGWVQAERI